MSPTSIDEPRTPAGIPAGSHRPRGWRWWLRVAEVRLRFVGLVLLALVLVTQWERLRDAWDRLWYASRAPITEAVSGETEYFCPMDPGVLSAWPAICPICNMDLVQRRKHDAQLLPEGVVARMQLSPYRVQLAGIRTSEVTDRPLEYEIQVAGRIVADELSGESAAHPLYAAISPDDASLLAKPRKATLTVAGETHAATAQLLGEQENAALGLPADVPHVRVTPDAESIAPLINGSFARATIHIPVAELNPASPALAIPESALVDHGDRQLVFVESMPGQFDAVPVTLGRRCGDHYPVLAGLAAGQRVATAGAFLIDAETRLNPSLAIAYFGANAASAESRAPQVRLAAGKNDAAANLSAEDIALAAAQKVCPVTDLPLDSMGGPVPVIVEGRKVFICCKACERKLKSDPAKYLAKLRSDDRPAD
jgi:Heavy metal binding domain